LKCCLILLTSENTCPIIQQKENIHEFVRAKHPVETMQIMHAHTHSNAHLQTHVHTRALDARAHTCTLIY
jgi:hypothetical protein